MSTERGVVSISICNKQTYIYEGWGIGVVGRYVNGCVGGDDDVVVHDGMTAMLMATMMVMMMVMSTSSISVSFNLIPTTV